MRGFLFILVPAVLAAQATQPPAPLATDDEKTIYALGLTIYRSLGQFDLSPAEIELVKRAISDAAANKPAVDLNTWGPKIQALATGRQSRVADREKASSKAFAEKAAAEPGAMKTDSGLIYRELAAGTGASPKAT